MNYTSNNNNYNNIIEKGKCPYPSKESPAAEAPDDFGGEPSDLKPICHFFYSSEHGVIDGGAKKKGPHIHS